MKHDLFPPTPPFMQSPPPPPYTQMSQALYYDLDDPQFSPHF